MKRATDELKANFKYFLSLLQAVLNSTPVPHPTADVDWRKVYYIALEHSLAGMLYCAVSKLPLSLQPDKTVMAYLKQMYQEQIVTDANLSLETDRLLSEFDALGIRCVPLKGILIKKDYPAAYLRTMSDVDILIDENKAQQMHDYLIHDGYVRESINEKDSSYRKEKILHYEMHTSLLHDKSPAYPYFSCVWDRVVFAEGSNVARLTVDDMYIYMLEHLANHTECGGAGVRMFMDVYVYLHKHSHEINREYVDRVIGNILLTDFEKCVVSICRNWFSGEEEIDVSTDTADFILCSCTFGRSNVAFLSDTIREDKDKKSSASKNGVKRILSKLFPGFKWMRFRYKAVSKLPFLYPFFIPVYWVHRLIIKRDVNTSNISSYFVSATSEDAEKLRGIFSSFGLLERI